jgi:hypothetical protein
MPLPSGEDGGRPAVSKMEVSKMPGSNIPASIIGTTYISLGQ